MMTEEYLKLLMNNGKNLAMKQNIKYSLLKTLITNVDKDSVLRISGISIHILDVEQNVPNKRYNIRVIDENTDTCIAQGDIVFP